MSLAAATVDEGEATPPPAARRVLATPTGAGPSTVLSRRPQRVDELRHMSLDRLRTYRRTLLSEELSTSYWRRLLQARRDVLRAGGPDTGRAALKAALTEERGSGGRLVILKLHPQGGMPILPHLPELWASEVVTPGTPEAHALATRLASAETVLSSYREALHRRLDRATADLVARYHEDPRGCFVALPAPRDGS